MSNSIFKRLRSTKLGNRLLPNIFVDSPALLRASIPFIVLVSSNALIMILTSWQLTTYHDQMIETNPENAVVLMQISSRIIIPLFWALALFSFVSLVIWLFHSHRIFGPIVSIRRRIKGLTNRDYHSRLQLRYRDEFKAIAGDLNELAESLQKLQDGKKSRELQPGSGINIQ